MGTCRRITCTLASISSLVPMVAPGGNVTDVDHYHPCLAFCWNTVSDQCCFMFLSAWQFPLARSVRQLTRHHVSIALESCN